ncbi:MAG: formimidoylglutamase [Nigerium sp.]|nr:formimidoylglutamase [Nigerium sp.]
MIDRPAAPWSGRDDGPGAEHARWHHAVNGARADARVALIGFASDEGVRRNQGRVGAAEGPAALRAALGGFAAPGVGVRDRGDVVVADGDLEVGQARLGRAVATVLERGALPVVIGGGHEVAFGSALGWIGRDETWGVLNLDAHLDLRRAGQATSGTPFAQIADALTARDKGFRYSVIGLGRPSNTAALVAEAARWEVAMLEDARTDERSALAAAEGLLAGVDRVHLTLDLDVLPASVAPGVSAPAAFGIPLGVVLAVLRAVAASGRLGLFEVAELNPRLDVDQRTARTAARCVDEVVRHLP